MNAPRWRSTPARRGKPDDIWFGFFWTGVPAWKVGLWNCAFGALLFLGAAGALLAYNLGPVHLSVTSG